VYFASIPDPADAPNVPGAAGGVGDAAPLLDMLFLCLVKMATFDWLFG